MDGRPHKRRMHFSHEGNEGNADGSSANEASSEPAASLSESRFGVSKSLSSESLSEPSRNRANPSSSSPHHSSFFNLQTDELLKKLRPKYETRMLEAGSTLRRLQDIIRNIPDRKSLIISEAQRTLEHYSSVCIPFPEPMARSESKLLLEYLKPTNINVTGSFSRKTALLLDGKVTIDVAVTMPAQLFQAKDYRDYRYFQKRAYYLACLADGIQKANIPSFALSFAYQDDNPLQPILIAEPCKGLALERTTCKPLVNKELDGPNREYTQRPYRIRILLAASSDLFPAMKTLPSKACIRQSALDVEETISSTVYNATLRSECCSILSLQQLNESVGQSDAFRDACMLGAIWLRQRGFGSSITRGGFGQFEWASVVASLMRGGGPAGRPLLSRSYSSHQLLKATLHFLSANDLVASPVLLQSSSSQLGPNNGPVFFDGSRGLNLLFKMSPWSYKMLRHEASISFRAMGDPLVDQFKVLFISRVCEPAKLVPLDVQNAIISSGSAIGGAVDFANKTYEKLKYGLGDRVSLICLQIPSGSSWQLTSRTSPLRPLPYMTVGLFLNPDTCRRTVDRGPPIEDKEASALFRDFWGDKAELRRFKDGTILESVIWSKSDSMQGLLDIIIRYILNRHFDLREPRSIGLFGKGFDKLLPQRTAAQTDMLQSFSSVRKLFELLCKSIRTLTNLPLQVRQLSAASPELRFSSLYAPEAGKPVSLKRPVEFHVQFEGSTRWPKDLVAIQRTKIAFLFKVAEGLDRDESVLTTSLGMGSVKHKLPGEPFLDIGTLDRVIFRLRIHHEDELGILEQRLSGHISSAPSREEIAAAISDWKRIFIQRPAHTQAVYTLSIRFPLLSMTIRLFTKWRDAHLLSSHIRDELIELLATRTFVHPYPWQPPGSLNSAFIRTLAFTANWDWQSDPLIVDFSSELTKQDIEAVNVRFEAWRKLDPGMDRVAMFAASNVDRDGITWTERRPAKVIASRFVNLAKAASDLVRERGLDLEPEALFTPSLAEYDFVIHLKPEYSESNQEGPTYKNLQMELGRHSLDAIFNPLQQFCDELEELYDDSIIFFYNRSVTTMIAGLWNPQTGPRDWKVTLDYSTVPVSESQVAINKVSILQDIARLGGDMVAKIEQKA
ncbi:MAG: hypothetical protein LQ343_002059 [Gyalolechia ehrenbergii]|nr:MAG: hypothetical protein LQ343_002059 [Gyalolechia ehrenbergii]